MVNDFPSPTSFHPEAVIIRPLDPQDQPAMQQLDDLRRLAWRANPHWSDAAVERRLRGAHTTFSDYQNYLVAVYEDKMVGHIGIYRDIIIPHDEPAIAKGLAQLQGSAPSRDRVVFGHIRELVVHPQVRRQGIATRLIIVGLKDVVQSAYQAELIKFRLTHSNERSLRPKLQANGFVRTRDDLSGYDADKAELRRSEYIGRVTAAMKMLETNPPA